MLNAQNRTILLVTLFIMLTGNLSLFQRISEVYPLTLANLPFLLSLAAFFSIATALFFLLICHGRATRWVLAFFLLASSQAAYYMDQYGVIIDEVMIDNILQTDPREVLGLVGLSLVLRTLLLGVLPAWLVLRHKPAIGSLRSELKARLLLLLTLLVALLLVVAPFTAGYASFIREHKPVRLFANPTYFSYSVFRHLKHHFQSEEVTVLKPVAPDAVAVGGEHRHELFILVVGETARADRFSLNGYARQTNPELAKQDVVSFTNASSCGTSTGESVPCMFSGMTRKYFDKEDALRSENVLDVLKRRGVEVLWRDNNSDSKGVAERVTQENFRKPELNPVCDDECRDVGMLAGLDRFITAHPERDLLIVLHQMGNHGPEYYKRYPKAFERFTPVCRSNELSSCSKQEIDNAYDNAILYTDYFLSQTIDFLKRYDGQYETAMLYLSDHGESLGEHGLYLHAAPYLIAPSEQTRIPVVLWLGRHSDFSIEQVKPYRDYPISHDDLFCTLLVGFEIQTQACAAKQHVLLENLDYKSAKPH